MTLFDHFVVLTFAVLYPAYGFFTYRNLKKDLIANKAGVRRRDYQETIAWLWSLSFTCHNCFGYITIER